MGGSQSKGKGKRKPSGSTGSGFFAIQDKFHSLDEVTSGLRQAGLESSNCKIPYNDLNSLQ